MLDPEIFKFAIPDATVVKQSTDLPSVFTVSELPDIQKRNIISLTVDVLQKYYPDKYLQLVQTKKFDEYDPDVRRALIFAKSFAPEDSVLTNTESLITKYPDVEKQLKHQEIVDNIVAIKTALNLTKKLPVLSFPSQVGTIGLTDAGNFKLLENLGRKLSDLPPKPDIVIPTGKMFIPTIQGYKEVTNFNEIIDSTIALRTHLTDLYNKLSSHPPKPEEIEKYNEGVDFINRFVPYFPDIDYLDPVDVSPARRLQKALDAFQSGLLRSAKTWVRGFTEGWLTHKRGSDVTEQIFKQISAQSSLDIDKIIKQQEEKTDVLTDIITDNFFKSLTQNPKNFQSFLRNWDNLATYAYYSGLISGQIAYTIPRSIATAFVGAKVGGPAGATIGGLLGAASSEIGNIYLELYQKGVPDEKAVPASILAGLINGWIEVSLGITPKDFIKPFLQPLKRNIVKSTLSTITNFMVSHGKKSFSEMLEEGPQGLVNNLAIKLTDELTNPKDGIFTPEIFNEMFSAFIGTFTSPIALTTTTFEHFNQKLPSEFNNIPIVVPQEAILASELPKSWDKIQEAKPSKATLLNDKGLVLSGNIEIAKDKILLGDEVKAEIKPTEVMWIQFENLPRTQLGLGKIPSVLENPAYINDTTDFYFKQFQKRPTKFLFTFRNALLKGLKENNPVVKNLVSQINQYYKNSDFSYLAKLKPYFAEETPLVTYKNETYKKIKGEWFSTQNQKITDKSLLANLEKKWRENIRISAENKVNDLIASFQEAYGFVKDDIEQRIKERETPTVMLYSYPFDSYTLDNPPPIESPKISWFDPPPVKSVEYQGERYWFYYPHWFRQQEEKLIPLQDPETLKVLNMYAPIPIFNAEKYLKERLNIGDKVQIFNPQLGGRITGTIQERDVEGNVLIRTEKGDVWSKAEDVKLISTTPLIPLDEVKSVWKTEARILLPSGVYQGHFVNAIPTTPNSLIVFSGRRLGSDNEVVRLEFPYSELKGVEFIESKLKSGAKIPSQEVKEVKSYIAFDQIPPSIWKGNDVRVKYKNRFYIGKFYNKPKNETDIVIFKGREQIEDRLSDYKIRLEMPFNLIQGVEFLVAPFTKLGEKIDLAMPVQTERIVKPEKTTEKIEEKATAPATPTELDLKLKENSLPLNIRDLIEQVKPRNIYYIRAGNELYDGYKIVGINNNNKSIRIRKDKGLSISIPLKDVEYIVDYFTYKELTSPEPQPLQPSMTVTSFDDLLKLKIPKSTFNKTNQVVNEDINLLFSLPTHVTNDLYVQSQVGIVDLDKVVPSHFFIITPDQVKVEENPRFPQTLQNRNFAQGVLFYREKLKKIDFFQLTSDSITPAWGVPTLMSIDGQLCVVAGNLRYNLLAEIYKNDEWTQSYKNHLQEYLKLHNINFDLSRIEKPILVKMVTQPLSPQEIVAFCYFANKVDVRYVGIMQVAAEVCRRILDDEKLRRRFVASLQTKLDETAYVCLQKNDELRAVIFDALTPEEKTAFIQIETRATEQGVTVPMLKAGESYATTFEYLPEFYDLGKWVLLQMAVGELHKDKDFLALSNNLFTTYNFILDNSHVLALTSFLYPEFRDAFRTAVKLININLDQMTLANKTYRQEISEDPKLSDFQKDLIFALKIILDSKKSTTLRDILNFYMMKITNKTEKLFAVEEKKSEELLQSVLKAKTIEDIDLKQVLAVEDKFNFLNKLLDAEDTLPKLFVLGKFLISNAGIFYIFKDTVINKIENALKNFTLSSKEKAEFSLILNLLKNIRNITEPQIYFVLEDVQPLPPNFKLKTSAVDFAKWLGIEVIVNPALITNYTAGNKIFVKSLNDYVLWHEIFHILDNVELDGMVSLSRGVGYGRYSGAISEELVKHPLTIELSEQEILAKFRKGEIPISDLLLYFKARQRVIVKKAVSHNPSEIAADAFARYMTQPQKLHKENPELYKLIDTVVQNTVLVFPIKLTFDELQKMPPPPLDPTKSLQLSYKDFTQKYYTDLFATAISDLKSAIEILKEKPIDPNDLTLLLQEINTAPVLENLPVWEVQLYLNYTLYNIEKIFKQIKDNYRFHQPEITNFIYLLDNLKRFLQTETASLYYNIFQKLLQAGQISQSEFDMFVNKGYLTLNMGYWLKTLNYLFMPDFLIAEQSDNLLDIKVLQRDFLADTVEQAINRLVATETYQPLPYETQTFFDDKVILPSEITRAIQLYQEFGFELNFDIRLDNSDFLIINDNQILINLKGLEKWNIGSFTDFALPVQDVSYSFAKASETIRTLEFFLYYQLAELIRNRFGKWNFDFNTLDADSIATIQNYHKLLTGNLPENDFSFCFALFHTAPSVLRESFPDRYNFFVFQYNKVNFAKMIPPLQIDTTQYYYVEKGQIAFALNEGAKIIFSQIKSYQTLQETLGEDYTDIINELILRLKNILGNDIKIENIKSGAELLQLQRFPSFPLEPEHQTSTTFFESLFKDIIVEYDRNKKAWYFIVGQRRTLIKDISIIKALEKHPSLFKDRIILKGLRRFDNPLEAIEYWRNNPGYDITFNSKLQAVVGDKTLVEFFLKSQLRNKWGSDILKSGVETLSLPQFEKIARKIFETWRDKRQISEEDLNSLPVRHLVDIYTLWQILSSYDDPQKIFVLSRILLHNYTSVREILSLLLQNAVVGKATLGYSLQDFLDLLVQQCFTPIESVLLTNIPLSVAHKFGDGYVQSVKNIYGQLTAYPVVIINEIKWLSQAKKLSQFFDVYAVGEFANLEHSTNKVKLAVKVSEEIWRDDQKLHQKIDEINKKITALGLSVDLYIYAGGNTLFSVNQNRYITENRIISVKQLQSQRLQNAKIPLRGTIVGKIDDAICRKFDLPSSYKGGYLLKLNSQKQYYESTDTHTHSVGEKYVVVIDKSQSLFEENKLLFDYVYPTIKIARVIASISLEKRTSQEAFATALRDFLMKKVYDEVLQEHTSFRQSIAISRIRDIKIIERQQQTNWRTQFETDLGYLYALLTTIPESQLGANHNKIWVETSDTIYDASGKIYDKTSPEGQEFNSIETEVQKLEQDIQNNLSSILREVQRTFLNIPEKYTLKLKNQDIDLYSGDIVNITDDEGNNFDVMVFSVSKKQLFFTPISAQEISLLNSPTQSDVTKILDENTIQSLPFDYREFLDALSKMYADPEVQKAFVSLAWTGSNNPWIIAELQKIYTAIKNPFELFSLFKPVDFYNLLKVMQREFTIVLENDALAIVKVIDVRNNQVVLQDSFSLQEYTFNVDEIGLQECLFSNINNLGENSKAYEITKNIVKLLNKYPRIGIVGVLDEASLARCSNIMDKKDFLVQKYQDRYIILKKNYLYPDLVGFTQRPTGKVKAVIRFITNLLDKAVSVTGHTMAWIKLLPEKEREVATNIWHAVQKFELNLNPSVPKEILKSLALLSQHYQKFSEQPGFAKELSRFVDALIKLEETVIENPDNAESIQKHFEKEIQKMHPVFYEMYNVWWNQIRTWGKKVIVDLVVAQYGARPPEGTTITAKEHWIKINGEVRKLTDDEIVSIFGRSPLAYLTRISGTGSVLILRYEPALNRVVPLIRAPNEEIAQLYIKKAQEIVGDTENEKTFLFYSGNYSYKEFDLSEIKIEDVSQVDFSKLIVNIQPRIFSITGKNIKVGDLIKFSIKGSTQILQGVLAGIDDDGRVQIFIEQPYLTPIELSAKELMSAYANEEGFFEILQLPSFLRKGEAIKAEDILFRYDPIRTMRYYVNTLNLFYNRYLTLQKIAPYLKAWNEYYEMGLLPFHTWEHLYHAIDYVLFGRLAPTEISLYNTFKNLPVVGKMATPYMMRNLIRNLTYFWYFAKLVAFNFGFLLSQLTQPFYNYIVGDAGVFTHVAFDFFKNGGVFSKTFKKFARKINYTSMFDERVLREVLPEYRKPSRIGKIIFSLVSLTEYSSCLLTAIQFYVFYRYKVARISLKQALEEVKTGNLDEEALLYAVDELAPWQGSKYRFNDPSFMIKKQPGVLLISFLRRWSSLLFSGILLRLSHPETYILTPANQPITRTMKNVYRSKIITKTLLLNLLLGGLEAFIASSLLPSRAKKQLRKELEKYLERMRVKAKDAKLIEYLTAFISGGFPALVGLDFANRVSLLNTYGLDLDRLDKQIFGALYSDMMGMFENIPQLWQTIKQKKRTPIPYFPYAVYKTLGQAFYNPQALLNTYNLTKHLLQKQPQSDFIYYSRNLVPISVKPTEAAIGILGLSPASISQKLRFINEQSEPNYDKITTRRNLINAYTRWFANPRDSLALRNLKEYLLQMEQYNQQNPTDRIKVDEKLVKEAFEQHLSQSTSYWAEQALTNPTTTYNKLILQYLANWENLSLQRKKYLLREWKSLIRVLQRIDYKGINGLKYFEGQLTLSTNQIVKQSYQRIKELHRKSGSKLTPLEWYLTTITPYWGIKAEKK